MSYQLFDIIKAIDLNSFNLLGGYLNIPKIQFRVKDET